ncbi:hypothetical protein [Neptuniibacter sp. QD37_11]|uniref:hypothetical protein n=1 Tax=Neptuniibacter sp. QD37_11 TaxID=3398209 RepID=UPI0039F4898E
MLKEVISDLGLSGPLDFMRGTQQYLTHLTHKVVLKITLEATCSGKPMKLAYLSKAGSGAIRGTFTIDGVDRGLELTDEFYEALEAFVEQKQRESGPFSFIEMEKPSTVHLRASDEDAVLLQAAVLALPAAKRLSPEILNALHIQQ